MTRAAAAAVLLATLLAGSGCVSLRRTGCPARGGPPWNDLVSDHFVVRTDLPPKRAAELVGRLERLRAAVAAALGVEPKQPGRIEVIAFRSRKQFRQFAPSHAAGYYLRYAGGPPRIVLSTRIDASERALLAHELTHHFLASAFWRQPRWFSEGVAVYMESLGEDEPGTDALTLGGVPGPRWARARLGLVPMRRLLTWDADPEQEARDAYATAWVLVHYLIHVKPEAFAELERRLAGGEDPLDAWRAALPEYAPERGTSLEGLDLTLDDYLRRTLVRQQRQIPVPAAVGYFEQPLPTAEYHAIRLTLWTLGPDRGRAALAQEVEEALEESPDHPIALQVKAQVLKEGDPVALARRAVAAHPDDPRGWVFLGQALPVGEERTEAYRRATELAPQNPAVQHALAEDLLDGGRAGEALPPARKAANAAPWSSPLLATYARALSELGRCDQAVPHQVRALEALPEKTPPDRRQAYVERLTRYLEQCRLLAPAAPAVEDGPPGGAAAAGEATPPPSLPVTVPPRSGG